MEPLVVDASVALKWFLTEDYTESALHVKEGGNYLHVPAFFLIEFGHVVCKKVRRQEIRPAEATEFIAAIRQMPMERHPDDAIFARAFDMGISGRMGLYDCMYLALAVELDCLFVTADKRSLAAAGRSEHAAHALWIEDLPGA